MLANLSQIKGGLALRADLDAIIASYDAAKVITSIVKSDDPTTVYYNVDELLATLKTNLEAVIDDEAITGEGKTTLATLKSALNAFKNQAIDDIVKVNLTATYENSAFTVDTTGVDSALIQNVELPVYAADNTTVFNGTTGNQLTFNLSTGAFSGTPTKLSYDTDAGNADGSQSYEAIEETFQFKVFPTGTFTLATLPQGALLDNQEMQLLAYDQAINKLVVELAKDQAVIDAIVAKVGEETVANQIQAVIVKSTVDRTVAGYTPSDNKVLSEVVVATDIATAVTNGYLNAALVGTLAVPESSEGAGDGVDAETINNSTPVYTKARTDQEIATAVANASATSLVYDQNNATRIDEALGVLTPVLDTIPVTGSTAVSSFTLTETPNAVKVKMFVNGMVYFEDEEFTVNRTTKTVTWTFSASQEAGHIEGVDGFTITGDVTDKVRFEYFTGTVSARTVPTV